MPACAGYAPLKIRNAVIPATRIGTWLGVPLCLIGVAINSEAMAYIGLAFYGFVALFQLITLPVEFDASKEHLQQFKTISTLQKTNTAVPKMCLQRRL